jgi:hypothetical protein
MSIVTKVSLATVPPNGCGPDPAGVRISGSAGMTFEFYGVTQTNPATVVLQASRSMSSATINGNQDGAVVVSGGDIHIFLVLTLNSTNYRDWTVRVRTDRDGQGTGTTFTGGNGGGGEADEAL